MMVHSGVLIHANVALCDYVNATEGYIPIMLLINEVTSRR